MEYTSKKAIIAEKYKITSIIMTIAKKTKVSYQFLKKSKTIDRSNQAVKVLNQMKKKEVYSVSIAKIFHGILIFIPYF